MNKHDQQNINFILNLSHRPNELQKWLESIRDCGDEGEIDYALDMLCAARNQIEIELLELHDQEAAEDLSQATEYLQRFRLQ